MPMFTPTNTIDEERAHFGKTTKNLHAAGLASVLAVHDVLRCHVAWYITSSHISSVAVSNNTSIAVPMWSKS